MPDEIVLAGIMTALDLEFKRALHYHDEGYDSDNDYRLPGQVMRPVHVYLVSTTKVSFNPADYKDAQFPTSPFMPRWPRDELPFHQGVHHCLTFDETPPPEVDSDDEEYFPTADFDDPVWSEEPVADSQKHLCIDQIPIPATPSPQPDQVEVPQGLEQMDIKILEDLLDITDVPKELLSDFDSWAHSVLEYQW